MKQYTFLTEAIDKDNSYRDALDIFNTLSKKEKYYACPKHGTLKNVPFLYRHVIKNKGFIDLYPYEGNKEIGMIVIAVNPKFRGQGITKELLNQTKKDAKKLGIKKLIWDYYKDNIDSKRAALSNGFEETWIKMEYDL